jgi:outer membrane beta-barrel protein
MAAALAAFAPVVASAQEDPDDLGDILGEDTPPKDSSVRTEREALESEGEKEERVKVDVPEGKRKVIKVLQEKSFVKVGRFEGVIFGGGITNDPFIRRILFGLDLGYHVTEIFQVELQGSFSPDLDTGDHKAVTKQIIAANQVSPEISRMMAHATLNVNFSPFYGKLATFGRNSIIFDLYGTFGTGIVFTQDDLELTEQTDDPKATATQRQIHPALTFGGGVRVMFGKVAGIRFEVRDLSYINVLESTQLELKNNLMLMGGVSIFFGRRME